VEHERRGILHSARPRSGLVTAAFWAVARPGLAQAAHHPEHSDATGGRAAGLMVPTSGTTYGEGVAPDPAHPGGAKQFLS
jgi:hypothetical protein